MVTRLTEKVGSYEVVAYLGREGRSRLYKVRSREQYPVSNGDHGFSTLQVFAQVAADDEVCGRFKQQAAEIIKVNHANLLRCLDAFTWPASSKGVSPCLVMEWPGDTRLSERLADTRHPLSRPEVAGLFRQILDGLMFSADHALSFRWFHPALVFLDGDQRIKLAGLNLACLEQGCGASLAGGEGFFDYIAPDYAAADQFGDEASCIFTFGACLFQALAGRLPFPSLTDRTADGDCFGGYSAAYVNRWRDPAVAAPQMESDARLANLPLTRALLDKCLQPMRASRYQKFSELQKDFEYTSRELHPMPALEIAPAPAMETPVARIEILPPAPRRRSRLIPAAAAAGFLLLLGLWIPGRGVRDEPPASGVASASKQETPPAVKEPPRVQLVFRSKPLAAATPPVRAAFRLQASTDWQAPADGIHVPPGVVDVRFERVDYETITRNVAVAAEAGQQVVAYPAEEEWKPREPLRQLQVLEAAWRRKAFDELAAEFSRSSVPAPVWPAHADRLARIRDAWFQELNKKQLVRRYESAIVEVTAPAAPGPEAPVAISIRQKNGNRWLSVRGPIRLRRGAYEMQFTRPDFDPILRPLAVSGDREVQTVAGPALAEWQPGAALSDLRAIESAWTQNDMDALTHLFARPRSGDFTFEPNARRLEELREGWFRKLMQGK